MATSTRRVIVPLLLAASFAPAAFGQVTSGKDPLGAARDLYASARYDEALAVLNDMRPTDSGNNSISDRRSIEQYRSLCLLALGRGPEAESAIAAVVTADPGYQPNESDASPRVRAAFSDVRKRLLPEIVTTRYAVAKASFDRKDYASSEQIFRQVIGLLDDPDMGGRLSDLRTLASGFLDLSVASSAPPPEPKKEVVVPPAPPPVPQPDPNHVYSVDDAEVTAPVPVRQDVPRIPPAIARQARDRGVLDLVIDERGRVVAINVRVSVHPMYDTLLMTSARDWKYQPATLGGKPVKFRKLIQINVTKPE